MSFSDYADRLDEAVMAHLADTQSATYTPASGDPVTIPVMVDRDVERTVAGMQGTVVERRTELSGYASDLADAKRGETVSVATDTWRLVSQLANDGGFVTWIVKPDR
ncbi:MAG: head-tail joining protein [Pseudomonadota bacterium]